MKAPAREIVGLLAVMAGLIALGALLATVDIRWVAGMGAVLLIAGGIYLGRRPDSEVT